MGVTMNDLEKRLEEDRIERGVNEIFQVPKWRPAFKKEFYIIQAATIRAARIEDWREFKKGLIRVKKNSGRLKRLELLK